VKFPIISEALRLDRLEPPRGTVNMVLDTDTYNEIDDQFAVVYAMLSPERLNVEAIYAAPFLNERSSSPADGMEKSYDEIIRLLGRLGIAPEGFVFRGSPGYLPGPETPHQSEAALDLVNRAMRVEDGPLYVAAIGAITNVASAILIEPAIIEHIVVVWLAGQPHHWPNTQEFNLSQDVPASRLLFDCGVPLVHIPCSEVAAHLLMNVDEMERCVEGCGAIGAYLSSIFKEYMKKHPKPEKEIWDIATIAWLINPAWVPTTLSLSPILTDRMTWGMDRARHPIRCAKFVHRDPVFQDLFTKLAAFAKSKPPRR